MTVPRAWLWTSIAKWLMSVEQSAIWEDKHVTIQTKMNVYKLFVYQYFAVEQHVVLDTQKIHKWEIES